VNPDRVQHADVRQLAFIAQAVHGRGAHAKLRRDLANAQERVPW
jgi:hypothetical protein